MSNPITPEPVSGACAYCKRTDVPVRTVASVGKQACGACAEIVDRGMTARGVQPVEPLPASWERDAQTAATRAAMAVRCDYESTMKALDKDNSDDRPRAYWLDSFPCPAWCAYPETHRNGDHPEERAHDSDTLAVTFATEAPSTAYAEYQAPEMKFFLTQGYREAEARVHVEKEGEPVAWATLDEAQQMAFNLLALVRQARGQEPLKVLPFDSHGKCTTRDCAQCAVEELA